MREHDREGGPRRSAFDVQAAFGNGRGGTDMAVRFAVVQRQVPPLGMWQFIYPVSPRLLYPPLSLSTTWPPTAR